MDKKVIVVSAVNLVAGGPLTVLRDCLKAFVKASLDRNYEIHFLISNRNLIDDIPCGNIIFHTFPKSKKSWLMRLYYEYYFFLKFSNDIGPVYSWFSLHDITPKVNSQKQYVYCHNPSVFLNVKFKDFFKDYKQYLFTKFYKYLYKINIKKNHNVIVQQHWLGDYFVENFNSKIVVSKPNIYIPFEDVNSQRIELNSDDTNLFFPAFPRTFKNHSIIIEALESKLVDSSVKIFFTLDGKENMTSNAIKEKAKNIDQIRFLGALTHKQTLAFLNRCDGLVFPSKIETWGLPITEAKYFNKPIIVSDLPYAAETVGDYEKVFWFDPYDSDSLVTAINKLVNEESYDSKKIPKLKYKEVNGWENLSKFIIN